MQILPIQRSTLQRGIQGRFALARLTQHRAASFRSVGIIDGDAPSWLEVTHSLGHEWQALLALLAWQLSVSDDCANSIPEQPRLQSLEARTFASCAQQRASESKSLAVSLQLSHSEMCSCFTAEPSPVLAGRRAHPHRSTSDAFRVLPASLPERRFSSVTLGRAITAQRSSLPALSAYCRLEHTLAGLAERAGL